MTKENILLFGGTTESKEIAHGIIHSGHALTISTASDDELIVPQDINFSRQIGKMDENEIVHYLYTNHFTTVICAVHPYAYDARNNIITACKRTNTNLLIYLRDDTQLKSLIDSNDIIYASDHIEAATIANQLSGNILLTTGSRNLEPYMKLISNSSRRIYARVLNCIESETALVNAGIHLSNCILARGPFSTADNISLIKKFNIKTLITKDGGVRGGTPEKLKAAATTQSKVILITRPAITESYCSNIQNLLNKL